MTEETLNQLLKELKSGLAQLYGSRLRGVYLYGSYAREEQDDESDLDILIILANYEHYNAEIVLTGNLISTLSLSYGVSISRKFITENHWFTSESALLRNVRAEAIAA
jgi:uncharacterized protein